MSSARLCVFLVAHLYTVVWGITSKPVGTTTFHTTNAPPSRTLYTTLLTNSTTSTYHYPAVTRSTKSTTTGEGQPSSVPVTTTSPARSRTASITSSTSSTPLKNTTSPSNNTKTTAKLTTKTTKTNPSTTGSSPTSTPKTTIATTTTPDVCPHRVWYWIADYVPASGSSSLTRLDNVDTAGPCIEACLNTSGVNRCKSVFFNPGERMCILYTFLYDEVGVSFVKTKLGFYFQWQCRTYSLPKCSSRQQFPVFRYVIGKYFDPGPDNRQEIDAPSVELCEQACAETWTGQERSCASFNYGIEITSICKLNYIPLQVNQSVDSDRYDFYEYSCFNDPGVCSSRTERNRVWYAFTNHTYVVPESEADDVIFGVSSHVGCQNLCFYHVTRSCKSVIYRPETKQCFIYSERFHQIEQNGSDIYQYRCPEKNIRLCSANMELVWAEFQGKKLKNHRDRVINGVLTKGDCQQECLKFSYWVCKSVEYDRNMKRCVLSGMNRIQTELLADGSDHVTYSEWLCKLESCYDNQGKVFFEFRNKTLKYRDDVIKYGVTTFYQCLSMCLNLTSVTCRSLEYSDKTLTCHLSQVTQAEAEDNELIDSTREEYRYVEWRCRTYAADRCHGDSVLYWSQKESSQLQVGYIQKFINIPSQEQCEGMCLENEDCFSLEYRRNTSECEIKNSNSDSEQITATHRQSRYLEWRCAKPEYQPCLKDEEVYWMAFVGRRYKNPSILTITHHSVQTLNACEQLCLKVKQDRLINCESIEYKKREERCLLFSGTARRNQLVKDDITYLYLERHCRKVNFNRCTPGTQFLPNITLPGRALISDPHGAVHHVSSLTQCYALCESFSQFQCESVDYSETKTKCILHATGQIDGLLVNDSALYNHYEMGCVVPVLPATSASDVMSGFTISMLLLLLLCVHNLCE